MKLLLSYFLLSQVVLLVASQEQPLDNSTFTLNPCWKGDGIIGCSSDCTSREICISGRIQTVRCEKSFLGIPTFCDKDTFKCSKFATCNPTIDKFICPEKGYFPHIYDCHKFFICKYKGARGVEATCNNQYYHPKEEQCVKFLLCNDFSPVDGLCRNKNGKIVTHFYDSRYYVLCNSPNPVLARCKEDFIYDTKDFQCEYDCKSSGKKIDKENRSCYYECKWYGILFHKYLKAEHKCCPNNEIFNANLKTCTPNVIIT